MLHTLPARLLFCDVSAAAFSLFRCLPSYLHIKILSKQSALQAVTHGFLTCVWLMLCYRGANWQAAVRRTWVWRGLPSPCSMVSPPFSTLNGLLSGGRPLAWQAASQQVPPHSCFACMHEPHSIRLLMSRLVMWTCHIHTYCCFLSLDCKVIMEGTFASRGERLMCANRCIRQECGAVKQ